MKFKIETITKLHTDNNKVFEVNEDIALQYMTPCGEVERIIGEIKEIREDDMILRDLKINGEDRLGIMYVPYDRIVDNSCSFVYCD